MRKKAQVFSIPLLMVVIFLLVYAYFVFDIKQSSFKVDIGDKQLSLLESYLEAEEATLLANGIIDRLMPQSIYELGKNGGYFKEPGCESYGGFVLWSNKNKKCFPNAKIIRNSTQNFLKKYVGEYLSSDSKLVVMMKKDNYDFVFKQANEKLLVKGIASAPLISFIYCGYALGKCGQYAPKPHTFTVIDYKLSVYDEIVEEVKRIRDYCLDQEKQGKNIKDCIKEEIGKKANWNLIEDEVEGKVDIDKERTFRISVIQDKKFFIYDEKTKIDVVPVEIKFAINIPDNIPPPPIGELEVVDMHFAERSVVLKWDKSKANDVEKYKIYYTPSDNEIYTISMYNLEEEIYLKDLENEIVNKNSDYYLYVLKVDEDGKDYAFAVTAIDYYDNEDSTIKISKIAKSKDDLPPGKVELKSPTYDGANKITLNWVKPTKNADDSVLEDLKGYKIYYKDSDFTDISTGGVIPFGRIDDPTTEIIDKDVSAFAKNKDYYFAVVAFDDEIPANEYEKVKAKVVRI